MPAILLLILSKIWTFLKSIPLTYVLAGIVAVGVFYLGYHLGSEHSTKVITQYKDRIVKVADQIAAGQTKIETKIVTQYKDRVVYVTKVADQNKETAQTIVPDQEEVSNGWVATHDAAAQNQIVDKDKAKDPTPSGVKSTDALGIVSENYGICETNKEQLESLQNWITETQANIEKANKGKKIK